MKLSVEGHAWVVTTSLHSLNLIWHWENFLIWVLILFLVVQSINGSTLYAGGEDYAVTGDAVINLDAEAEAENEEGRVTVDIACDTYDLEDHIWNDGNL